MGQVLTTICNYLPWDIIQNDRQDITKSPGTLLTHWGRVAHTCVGNLTIIGSDNGLSPGRRQAINWTSAGILLIGPLRTNFSEMVYRNSNIFFQQIAFESVVCEMAGILFGCIPPPLSAKRRSYIPSDTLKQKLNEHLYRRLLGKIPLTPLCSSEDVNEGVLYIHPSLNINYESTLFPEWISNHRCPVKCGISWSKKNDK